MKIDWKKVLVPTDLSEGSKDALPYAIGIARETGAPLTLVHVVHTPPRAELLAYGVIIEEERLMAEARKQLDAFRQREIPSDIQGPTVVLKGHPAEEITRLAADQKFDLIVIATHGRSGLKHLWFGSTAENVVRRAPCAVLTVRERPAHLRQPEQNPIRVRKILAPTDFSDLSIEALSEGVALAKRVGARVDVIFVNQPPPYTEAEFANLIIIESALREASEGRLEKLKEAVPGLNAVLGDFIVRIGSAALEIVQAALVLNSELIVMTTHGHTGLKHIALGSTAERVVRHAACPVLLLRR